MKKTLLAAAIPALMMATSASAVELYNDGANSVSLGGHATVELRDVKNGDTKVTDNSGRINFAFNRAINDDLSVEAKMEWSMDFVEQEGDLFGERLGYIGLKSEKYGLVRAGQQWGVFIDVAGVADMPIQFGNDYLYTDHTALGIARAERAITYRKGVDLGNAGKLNIGLQWQGDNEEAAGMYDARTAFAISYELMGATVGYAQSTGEVDGVDHDVDAISLKYGSWGKGLYVAGNYSTSENVFGGYADAVAYDAVVSYAYSNGLNLSVNYETVEDDNSSEVDLETAAFIAAYPVAKNLTVYGGYEADLEDKYSEDNSTAVIGARVYF
ncbi:porin [uncultured Ferrimonas sp.]|uniref:porin n=1 Tax=uncultured Ferrimonas sp. TaxID=432640 RepID=UPI0026102BFA|nr:porin [uncultured Ferrimonas sp.]